MFGLLSLSLVVLGGVVVVLLALRSRSRSDIPAPIVDSRHAVDVAAQVQRTRTRLTLALALFVAIGFVATLDPMGLQPRSWLGLGNALGLAVAAIIAGLVLAASPMVSWPRADGVRTADLVPRSGGSFGPRWGFALPLASAGILILFLIVTGLTSVPDDLGLYRAFTVEIVGGSSTASPYPGWYYGVPVIAATLVLAGVVLLVLNRVAAAPRPTNRDLYAVDDALRRSVTRFIMLLSSSALLAYFGGVAAIAGNATSNTATHWTESPDWQVSSEGVVLAGDYLPLYLQPTYAIGIVESIVGVALLALAIVLLVFAAATSTLRWASVVSEPETVAA